MNIRRASSWSGKNLLLLVTLFVVIAWIASIFVIPLLVKNYYGLSVCESGDLSVRSSAAEQRDCLADKMAAYGTFGDSFGAINALFSGLALAGVVLTLFLHSEAAKRTAKPFIVLKMLRREGIARISIGEPVRGGAIVRLPLKVVVPLLNSSSFPAINIDVTVQIEGITGAGSDVTDLPLAANDSGECIVELDIVGQSAQAFGQGVSGNGVKMTLRAEYDSVEGVRWYSEAKYLLKTNPNRGDDVQLLQHAIDGRMAEASRWTAETTIDLDFSTLSGSWGYGEVKK